MNRNFIFAFFLFLIASSISLGACSRQSDAQKAKEEYTRNLKDSIDGLKLEIDSCVNAISELREKQDVWLRDFVTVDNPREAAPYMIFHGFQDKYPPKATGLIARLAENGQFELVASLAGSQFNQIAVAAGEDMISSDVVPADQALNYTADGLTTVLFTGQKADSIGRLIADNDLNIITVNYLNGNPVHAWKMPNDYRKMVMASFALYDAQKSMNRMERRIPLLSRKIDLLRSHIDKNQPDSTATSGK